MWWRNKSQFFTGVKNQNNIQHPRLLFGNPSRAKAPHFYGFIYNPFCNPLLHTTCSVLWNQLTNYKVLNWTCPDPAQNKISTALLIWKSNLENRKGRQQTCISGRHQGTFKHKPRACRCKDQSLPGFWDILMMLSMPQRSHCKNIAWWSMAGSVFVMKGNMRSKRVLDIRIHDINVCGACTVLAFSWLLCASDQCSYGHSDKTSCVAQKGQWIFLKLLCLLLGQDALEPHWFPRHLDDENKFSRNRRRMLEGQDPRSAGKGDSKQCASRECSITKKLHLNLCIRQGWEEQEDQQNALWLGNCSS